MNVDNEFMRLAEILSTYVVLRSRVCLDWDPYHCHAEGYRVCVSTQDPLGCSQFYRVETGLVRCTGAYRV